MTEQYRKYLINERERAVLSNDKETLKVVGNTCLIGITAIATMAALKGLGTTDLTAVRTLYGASSVLSSSLGIYSVNQVKNAISRKTNLKERIEIIDNEFERRK